MIPRNLITIFQEVTREEGQILATEKDFYFYETSAKENITEKGRTKVEEMVEEMVKRMHGREGVCGSVDFLPPELFPTG